MSRCAAVAPYSGGAFLPASTAPGSLFSVSPLPFVRWCPSRQALQGGIHKAALYKTSPLQGLPPGALSSHGNGLTENGEQGRIANRQKRKNERRGIFGAGEPGEKIMAIAKNFLKFPQAMALQWPLPLGKPRWNTSRPTTRLGRAIRAFISRAVKAAAALPHAEKLERAGAVKKPAPQWWRDAKRRAQKLAKKIKDSCMNLEFYQVKECDQAKNEQDCSSEWHF